MPQGAAIFGPEVKVTLISTPVVTAMTSASFCWGGSATLGVTVIGSPAVTYLWSRNAIPIAGATNSTYNATITGTYGCTVTAVSGGCFAISTLVPVYQNPLPNPLVTFDGKIFKTQDTFIYYQWFKNLVLIPGATTYKTPATTNGNYKVEVTDGNGCQSFSDIFVLTGWTSTGGGVGVPVVKKGEFRIFPNPAQTMVHIESADEVRAVISGIDGRMLIQQDAAKDIDITRLADGVYTIMLYDTNGQMVKAEKLVKTTN